MNKNMLINHLSSFSKEDLLLLIETSFDSVYQKVSQEKKVSSNKFFLLMVSVLLAAPEFSFESRTF